MFLPSIIISPLADSKTLKIARRIVDFPDPVLPTIPTFSPGLILNLRPFNTKGKSSLY